MTRASIVVWAAAIALGTPSDARANATCSSVLTADQLRELDRNLLSPDRPYSAHLSEASEDEGAQGTVKRLSKADIEKLRGAIAHPFVGSVRDIQSQEQITPLKTWLKANPSAELPAWDATAGGPDARPALAWVPGDWVTRPADRFVNLVKESGNAGPIKSTVLGAATSVGQLLGVTQHVAADSSGHDMFLWSYIYQATIAGRRLTTLLAICEADLVAMSDDER